jgi:hypothetical protein
MQPTTSGGGDDDDDNDVTNLTWRGRFVC